MFIVNLTYIKPLETVETVLPDHIDFLNHYYNQGIFIASGRKKPRTGGIILMLTTSHEDVQNIIQQDPFYQHKIAEYEIIEFEVSKYNPEILSLDD